jgi:hypothetical protein
MALPKGAIFGAELFGLTALSSAAGNSRAADPVAPVRDQAAEVAYLTYGGRILLQLQKTAEPQSDRRLYEAVKADAAPVSQENGFLQFRQALDEMISRGLVRLAGKDPEFGDPLYVLAVNRS